MPIRSKVSAAAERETAETLALQGLAFLFEDPARMVSFLKLTGQEPAEVRERVGTPELSLAVLEHLAGDESLLLVFAASRGIEPEGIGRAIALLGGARP
jgi:hypothetical protein